MCESAIAVLSGAVQEKSDHPHLKAGSYSLGSAWLSVIAWISRRAALGVFTKYHTGRAALTTLRKDVPAPKGPLQRR